jgi:hypothetical protein
MLISHQLKSNREALKYLLKMFVLFRERLCRGMKDHFACFSSKYMKKIITHIAHYGSHSDL